MSVKGKQGSVNSAGFSLVEVALSLAIVAVAMMGVLALLPVGLDSARQVHAETVAANVARTALAQFSSNAANVALWSQITTGTPDGRLLKTEYWPVDGQVPADPTSQPGRYFRLEFKKGTHTPAIQPTTCRYFLQVSWPEDAVRLNPGSSLIQRRVFLVDLMGP